jgi:hypothetical protein
METGAALPQSTVYFFQYVQQSWEAVARAQPDLSPEQVGCPTLCVKFYDSQGHLPVFQYKLVSYILSFVVCR